MLARKKESHDEKRVWANTAFFLFAVLVLVSLALWRAFVVAENNHKEAEEAKRALAEKIEIEKAEAKRLEAERRAIVPWDAKAVLAVKRIMLEHQVDIARATVYSSHELVSNATLLDYEISNEGKFIEVIYRCGFTGDWFGTDYIVKAKWSFSDVENFGVEIIFDETLTGATEQGEERLNGFFQKRIYPAVLKKIENQ